MEKNSLVGVLFLFGLRVILIVRKLFGIKLYAKKKKEIKLSENLLLELGEQVYGCFFISWNNLIGILRIIKLFLINLQWNATIAHFKVHSITLAWPVTQFYETPRPSYLYLLDSDFYAEFKSDFYRISLNFLCYVHFPFYNPYLATHRNLLGVIGTPTLPYKTQFYKSNFHRISLNFRCRFSILNSITI